MAGTRMSDLKILNEIENQIIKIQDNLKTTTVDNNSVTSLAIDISSLNNMISDAEQVVFKTDDIKQQERLLDYKHALSGLTSKLNELNRQRLERTNFNEVTHDTENDDNDLSESQLFYKKNTRKLDDILSDAYGNLSALSKQRRFIDKTKSTLLRGRDRMKWGGGLIRSISARYVNDFYIFMAGVFLVVFLIILVKIFV